MLKICCGCPAYKYDYKLCSEYQNPVQECEVGMIKGTLWHTKEGWYLIEEHISHTDLLKVNKLTEALYFGN